MSARKFITIYQSMGRARGQKNGHLKEHRGSWLLRYYVDSADEFNPVTGKPLRERITVTIGESKGPNKLSKREAQRIAQQEYLAQVNASNMRPSSGKPLEEFVNSRFYPDYLPTLKASGQVHYRYMLTKHVLPALGKVKLRDVTVERVQDLLTQKGRVGLSTQTVVHIRNCISAVLRHAKVMGWYIGELPTVGVRLPEMTREERMAPTWEQVCQLTAALPEPAATLVVFLTVTGLRIGEAMGLRVGRLNLTAEPILSMGEILPPFCVAVRESYVRNKYQTLKTKTSCRLVPIPEWLVPRLALLVNARQFGESVVAAEPVFANGSRSAPIDQHNLAARVLKPAARALGMPWISWHCFRHAYSTLMDRRNLTMAERMKLMGHTTPAVTMQYTHPEFQEVRLKIDGMVDPKLLQ